MSVLEILLLIFVAINAALGLSGFFVRPRG